MAKEKLDLVVRRSKERGATRVAEEHIPRPWTTSLEVINCKCMLPYFRNGLRRRKGVGLGTTIGNNREKTGRGTAGVATSIKQKFGGQYRTRRVVIVGAYQHRPELHLERKHGGQEVTHDEKPARTIIGSSVSCGEREPGVDVDGASDE